jgi:hypothetical protein
MPLLGHLLRTWPPAISVKTTLRFSHRSETSVCTYSVPRSQQMSINAYYQSQIALIILLAGHASCRAIIACQYNNRTSST